ncbi:MAG: hypothetical protein ACRCYR_03690 [Phycicoccus sp.]
MSGVIDALRDNAVLVSLLVGAVTPLLTSVVQQPALSDRSRRIVAVVVSAVIGVVVAATSGELAVNDWSDFAELTGVVGVVWAAAEAFYQKVWKPTGVAPAIEGATIIPMFGPKEASPSEEPDDLEYKSAA